MLTLIKLVRASIPILEFFSLSNAFLKNSVKFYFEDEDDDVFTVDFSGEHGEVRAAAHITETDLYRFNVR